jgi:hypothetical protein
MLPFQLIFPAHTEGKDSVQLNSSLRQLVLLKRQKHFSVLKVADLNYLERGGQLYRSSLTVRVPCPRLCTVDLFVKMSCFVKAESCLLFSASKAAELCQLVEGGQPY